MKRFQEAYDGWQEVSTQPEEGRPGPGSEQSDLPTFMSSGTTNGGWKPSTTSACSRRRTTRPRWTR